MVVLRNIALNGGVTSKQENGTIAFTLPVMRNFSRTSVLGVTRSYQPNSKRHPDWVPLTICKGGGRSFLAVHHGGDNQSENQTTTPPQ